MFKPIQQHPSRYNKIVAFFQKKGFFSKKQTREQGIVLFFGFLLLILVLRLTYLQVIQWSTYRKQLSIQHSSKVDIDPKRGKILAYDDAWQEITLATNADIYTLFVDPKFVWDTKRVTEILTPLLYEHFCKIYGLNNQTTEECIQNIESFSQTTILPRYQTIHYQSIVWDEAVSLTGQLEQQGTINIENQKIEEERQAIISWFTQEEAESRISATLETMLVPWKRSRNYVGFFDSPALLEALSGDKIPSVAFANTYYLYVYPDKVKNAQQESSELGRILSSYGYNYSQQTLLSKFSWQDTRYVKITENINATIAEKIQEAAKNNYQIKSSCEGKNSSNCDAWIPLLHGIWLEKHEKRYYPLWTFAANVLGYVTPNGGAMYGIEQYFDSILKGVPGHVVWLSTPWIGEIWSNDVSIINPIDGEDVYLTINPFIQKKVENLINHYVQEFRADSISILIMNPFSGDIVASANGPTFNPNNPQASYALKPLTPEDSYLITNDSYVDIPIYYTTTGNKLQIATTAERTTITWDKYVAKNLLGAQVFVDKNIAFPYEPGSIIKPFTVAAALDNDEITLYDFYSDPDGEVKIDLWGGNYQFIRNADQTHCRGTNTFLHALTYSCNVWLVNIAQKVRKEAFFNYMQNFWFSVMTNIELAWEDAWFLDTAANAWLARFFNTSFWQGMLATPMQIAAGYSILVNWGYYIKPRIVQKTYNPETKKTTENPIKKGAQILKPETSEKMKRALFEVVYWGLTKQFGIPWYTLGGKSGTSQIAYRGVYRSGAWRTHGSFVGLVTEENPKYIVVIQVRRPRSNQFGEYTAGKIFGDLSKILIEKDLIVK